MPGRAPGADRGSARPAHGDVEPKGTIAPPGTKARPSRPVWNNGHRFPRPGSYTEQLDRRLTLVALRLHCSSSMSPEYTLNDLQLLKLSRNGDHDAFGQLIRKHYRSCVNVATSILRDRTEAEDQVQQAISKAFEHLEQYLGEAEFFTWLVRIVVNECRMRLRAKKQARLVYLSDGPDTSQDRHAELLSPAGDPEYHALRCEMRDVLKTEIQHIPSLFREVILLRDVQELPIAEVAYQLGITVSAAKSRLLRARIELRKRVTQRFQPARDIIPLLSKQTVPAKHVQDSGFAA